MALSGCLNGVLFFFAAFVIVLVGHFKKAVAKC
jgi:hypothetical protein